MPQLPKAAYDLVEEAEGRRLTAYRCPAGKLTIGVGHTGPDVTPGLTITRAEADRLFERDMQAAAKSVLQMVNVPLTANMLGALTSWVFNLGAGTFRKSTLRVLLNRSAFAEAADEFPRWVHGGGRILPGLVKRRLAERALFLAEDVDA